MSISIGMEIILNELKQYDLKKINPKEIKVNSNYIGYTIENKIDYFYVDKYWFDEFEAVNYVIDDYNEVYEFANESFNKYDIVIETFFNFCYNLKILNETNILNKVKNDRLYLTLFYNWRKKNIKISIHFVNANQFVYYTPDENINKYTTIGEFVESVKNFIFLIEKGKILTNMTSYYYE